MSPKNSPNEGMETSMSLQNKFAQERERADAAYYGKKPLEKTSVVPADEDEYKAECSVLPRGFLDAVNADKLLSDDFMYYWSNGLRCCVAVLPFADNCSGKAALEAGGRWEDFLENQDYIRLMLVNSNGLGQRFENDVPAYWFQMLPELLQKDISEGGCTFTIQYPEPRLRNHEMNREWMKEQIRKALENLRKLFGEHFGSEPGAKAS